ncbi:hypothetical protein N7492_008340 [Penicillium capsulatum]|uniref:Uncharacterized protein n=1 Tax=Penicillium capsulatum TaxID=69766 RepID=A0A9W9HRG8_9EURO|nr:hypothetical protein N7492_008340 [Penicillium capsulatum]KAJ6105743.1 hypothetical protein N7512_009260 [Penicillium capsulatum]
MGRQTATRMQGDTIDGDSPTHPHCSGPDSGRGTIDQTICPLVPVLFSPTSSLDQTARHHLPAIDGESKEPPCNRPMSLAADLKPRRFSVIVADSPNRNSSLPRTITFIAAQSFSGDANYVSNLGGGVTIHTSLPSRRRSMPEDAGET